MKILVDIGNTRLKWAKIQGSESDYGVPLLHQHKKFKLELQSAWSDLKDTPEMLAISCVGKYELVLQIQEVAQQLWPGIEFFMPSVGKKTLGVKNGYRQPEKLGLDRWLALIAVREKIQVPACIIDCGTAITIDFIDANGQHLGGIICPGLLLMKQSLAESTEQLPFSVRQSVLGLANHTRGGIYSGTMYAVLGMIEKILSTQDRRGTKVFLTGGDAETISQELPMEHVVEPYLVLQGLLAVVNAEMGNG